MRSNWDLFSIRVSCRSGGFRRRSRGRANQRRLEKRYIWRILEALNWGFSDWDDQTVRLDLECLSDADRQKLSAVALPTRVVQLCLFLQVLFGQQDMKKLVEGAVEETLA